MPGATPGGGGRRSRSRPVREVSGRSAPDVDFGRRLHGAIVEELAIETTGMAPETVARGFGSRRGAMAATDGARPSSPKSDASIAGALARSSRTCILEPLPETATPEAGGGAPLR